MLMIMERHDIHAEVRNAQVTAVAKATLTVADLPPWLGKACAAVAELLTAQRAGPVGPPFDRFHMLGGGRFEAEAGFPATRPIGPYEQIKPGYAAFASWVGQHGGKLAGDA